MSGAGEGEVVSKEGAGGRRRFFVPGIDIFTMVYCVAAALGDPSLEEHYTVVQIRRGCSALHVFHPPGLGV